MNHYAQIDEAGLCVGELQTEGTVAAAHMIPVGGPGYIGRSWSGTAFSPLPEAAERLHVSVGAFFDRFGAEKWGILASTAPAVQAVVKDASVRRYIDLANPDLPAGLAILTGAGFDIDATAILTAPVQPGERP